MVLMKTMAKMTVTIEKRKKVKKVDTRQMAFLNLYMNPKSDTFGNAYQSALLAGFSENYSRQITSRAGGWLAEIDRRRENMLNKAERNLEEFLDLDPLVDAMGPNGPIVNKETGEVYKRYSTSIASLKLQATTFVGETLGKKTYSKRAEFGFIDPASLQLSEAEKAEIAAIYQENIPKQLTTSQCIKKD